VRDINNAVGNSCAVREVAAKLHCTTS